jgi:hypothetical protein
MPRYGIFATKSESFWPPVAPAVFSLMGGGGGARSRRHISVPDLTSAASPMGDGETSFVCPLIIIAKPAADATVLRRRPPDVDAVRRLLCP